LSGVLARGSLVVVGRFYRMGGAGKRPVLSPHCSRAMERLPTLVAARLGMRAKRRERLATGRTLVRFAGAAQPGTAMTAIAGLGAVVVHEPTGHGAATAHPALVRRLEAIVAIAAIARIAVPARIAAPDHSAAPDAADRLAACCFRS
jgi:hypothetical protein